MVNFLKYLFMFKKKNNQHWSSWHQEIKARLSPKGLSAEISATYQMIKKLSFIVVAVLKHII